MICDVDSGICGPTGESTSPMGFIDLSASQDKAKLVNEEQKDVEISSAHSEADDTNTRA